MQENENVKGSGSPETPIFVPMYDKKGRQSICSIFSLSRTKGKDLAKQAGFPKPVALARNCNRYRLDEVLAWMDSQRKRTMA
jgi:predicted DNA-binding transcriptional regulator AlpA